jgi:hypothetical protein
VARAAEKYGIPIVGLLAMLKAESNLNRTAERWGVWPDISFGYSQLIVLTAAGYGFGDGSNTAENIAAVRDALFGRETAIDVGAHHLSGCYGQADQYDYGAMGLSHDLAALTIYNAGHLPLAGDPWWERWAGNIVNYAEALVWAATMVVV